MMIYKKTIFALMLTGGGGILGFLNAIELSDIPNKNSITTNYDEITNHSDIGTKITIQSVVGSFINYGTITNTGDSVINIGTLNQRSGQVGSIINYGSIVGNIWVDHTGRLDSITNYGYMGGIGFARMNGTSATINSFGLISHYSGGGSDANIFAHNGSVVLIQNYAIRIDESADTFSKFTGTSTTEIGKTSHLKINTDSTGSVRFKDDKSKIILDFGNNFEFEKAYSLDKIMVRSDNGATIFNVPLVI